MSTVGESPTLLSVASALVPPSPPVSAACTASEVILPKSTARACLSSMSHRKWHVVAKFQEQRRRLQARLWQPPKRPSRSGQVSISSSSFVILFITVLFIIINYYFIIVIYYYNSTMEGLYRSVLIGRTVGKLKVASPEANNKIKVTR